MGRAETSAASRGGAPRGGDPRVPSWVVGRSAPFGEVLDRIVRLADYDVPVLVEGETGTGKDVIVRLLHYLSGRAPQPFVPVNAGALPDSLFEKELFGHAAGAFTDAKGRGKGLVEVAEGGTLFLDEIDSLSAHGQVALLRFLQDGSYRPVGATRDAVADVRVVTATNADPNALLDAGRVRRDLYYRLSGITVRIPPLRERPDDVLPLAEHFLAELNARAPGRRARRLGAELPPWLLRQAWPGNVRELRSTIEHCFIMSDGEALGLPRRAAGAREPAPAIGFREAKARAVTAFERDYLEELMHRHRGNVTRAALAAGKERKAFSRLLRKHGVERARYTQEPA
ncbi:MAG: sigma-54-dependent Fis family transcriptional regulator [Alphaproteobacteria bacterium]|nr:sigma-54-dependent Fis family transcriptional regulator [Alphaproteobacteria bacterium]MBV9373202.1 sigma-54-dependent Fis family transcriptional regulator [Alphaproteobacteria bacterium]MBV9900291.1 sigma-54-dependent Fis family transcriptional regulator [Alphaproteobacteria bacterium]